MSLETDFVAACQDGDLDAVRTLLSQGVDPDSMNDDGITGLIGMIAEYDLMQEPMQKCYLSIAKLLLHSGASPDMPDSEGHTPLMKAAMCNAPEFIALLVESGADIEAKGDGRNSALTWATIAKNVRCAKVLLDLGAEISTTAYANAALSSIPEMEKMFAVEKPAQISSSQEKFEKATKIFSDLNSKLRIPASLHDEVSLKGTKKMKLRTLLSTYGYKKRSVENTAEIAAGLELVGLSISPDITKNSGEWACDIDDWIVLKLAR